MPSISAPIPALGPLPLTSSYTHKTQHILYIHSPTPLDQLLQNMIEAAAQSFLAARQRYRDKKRISRSSSGKSLDRASLCGEDRDIPRRICSRHSGRELQLEDSECEALSAAFAAMPDKYYLFEAMFLRLFLVSFSPFIPSAANIHKFEQGLLNLESSLQSGPNVAVAFLPSHFQHIDPQIAVVFGMAGIPEQELRRKTPFRTHVCKFQRFITTVMDLLPKRGREEELVQIVRMVGRQHCQVKQLSFTAARWLSFKSALLSAFSRGEQRDKLHSQWSVLISFLIYEIKDAYLSHIRTLRSNSLPQLVESYQLVFRRKKSQSQMGPVQLAQLQELAEEREREKQRDKR